MEELEPRLVADWSNATSTTRDWCNTSASSALDAEEQGSVSMSNDAELCCELEDVPANTVHSEAVRLSYLLSLISKTFVLLCSALIFLFSL